MTNRGKNLRRPDIAAPVSTRRRAARRGNPRLPLLARRLLFPLMLMCATALTACIIPTPLEQAAQEANDPPVLVPGTAQPPFGELDLLSTTPVQIILDADDPNIGDTLTLRLFKPGSTGSLSRVYTGQEATMMAPGVPDPDHPIRRRGGFQSLDFCGLFGPTTLFVVVADRPFSTVAGHENEVPGGLYDEKAWDLRCQ